MIKIIIIFSISFVMQSKAQSISFTQDPNGNRLTRTYSPVRLANPDPKTDSSAFFQSTLGITVYPNPVSTEVSVRIDSMEEGENAIVQVADELGRILLERNQVGTKLSVNFESFNSGIYYLKIYFRKKTMSYKLVKV